MFDKLQDECGVFGIFGSSDASAQTALGLHSLQHRGHEAAGIVSYDNNTFNIHHALGLVGDNFNSQDAIDKLTGNSAIGHVRYSTTGDTLFRNIQPLYADLNFGGFALAHNGNLTNANTVKKQLVQRGCIFQSTSDTEAIIHLVAISKYETVVDRLVDALKQLHGAYSIVAMTKDCLMAARDPAGIRPLVLGKLGDAYVVASETCALDIIGATFIRDIEAGEVIVINEIGIQSFRPFPPHKKHFCIFEYIYFARPDSVLEGKNVYAVRRQIGEQLAMENGIDADVVVPVPDSGVPAAIGYAATSKLPFELGIIRNHYVGRTFIEPTDHVRHLGVKLKHNANVDVIKGKRVVLVDDSIVRGTTSKKIVSMVRDAGAKEVHLRIASPPTMNPCFYGVDTPKRSKLLAANYSIAEMAKFIEADSLGFLSIEGLYKAVGQEVQEEYCDACFSGCYPIPLTDKESGQDDKQTSLLKILNDRP